ncbi:MAG: hypothetical protein RR674_08600 [Anaerorhabdus sp.]
MKQKIIFFLICFFTYILLFIFENAILSFVFTLLEIGGVVMPICTLVLLILINPPVSWILANSFYNKFNK